MVFDSLIEDKFLRGLIYFLFSHSVCVWWCGRVSVFSNFHVWVLDFS